MKKKLPQLVLKQPWDALEKIRSNLDITVQDGRVRSLEEIGLTDGEVLMSRVRDRVDRSEVLLSLKHLVNKNRGAFDKLIGQISVKLRDSLTLVPPRLLGMPNNSEAVAAPELIALWKSDREVTDEHEEIYRHFLLLERVYGLLTTLKALINEKEKIISDNRAKLDALKGRETTLIKRLLGKTDDSQLTKHERKTGIQAYGSRNEELKTVLENQQKRTGNITSAEKNKEIYSKNIVQLEEALQSGEIGRIEAVIVELMQNPYSSQITDRMDEYVSQTGVAVSFKKIKKPKPVPANKKESPLQAIPALILADSTRREVDGILEQGETNELKTNDNTESTTPPQTEIATEI